MTTHPWYWPVRPTTTLFILDGQYWVKPTFALPPVAPDLRDDATLLYASAQPDQPGLLVVTGTVEGPVELTVQFGDDIVEQDPAAWEIVDDVVVDAPGDDLIITTTDDVYDELPRIELPPGARVAVRLHTRGVARARALGEIDPDDDVVEHHLLQVRVL